MRNKCEVILTGQLSGEIYLLAIFNPVEMKEPGWTQVPGCKLSKTSPRRPQDVTKNIFIIIYLS